MDKKQISTGILRIIPFLFSIVTLGILILLVRALLGNYDFSKEQEENLVVRENHFGFFIPVADQAFFDELERGAKDAEDKYNCFVSFYAFDKNLRDLTMVPYLGIDGVAIYPMGNDSQIKGFIKLFEDKGLPVIQIENEINRDEKSFYIGSNNFDTGRAIGQISEKSGKGLLNIELIYTEKNPGLLYNRGIVEMGLRNYLGSKINRLNFQTTSLNPLDAEGIVYDIVKNYPDVDLLVLTDPGDSLVAVQAIIDTNMVGEIQIISFGESHEIVDYMSKGLILGSVVRNSYDIGFAAVKSLSEILETGYTSSYNDTGIKILW